MSEIDELLARIETPGEAANWMGIAGDAARMLPDIARRLWEAEDRAERLREKYSAEAREHVQDLQLLIAVAAERDALLKDRARLDWLEKDMTCGRDDIDNRYRYFDLRLECRGSYGAKTIRAAIDAAMGKAEGI